MTCPTLDVSLVMDTRCDIRALARERNANT